VRIVVKKYLNGEDQMPYTESDANDTAVFKVTGDALALTWNGNTEPQMFVRVR